MEQFEEITFEQMSAKMKKEKIFEDIKNLQELKKEIEKTENKFIKNQLQQLTDELEKKLQNNFDQILDLLLYTTCNLFKKDDNGNKNVDEEFAKTLPDNKTTEVIFNFINAFNSMKKVIGEEESNIVISNLPIEIKQEIESILQNSTDSGRSYILDNPVIKKITRPQEKSKEEITNILLSSRENAMMTIIDGYLTPYEKEILETIMKYKQDGQVTQKGKIFCTIGQIYRGVRGGGEQSPTKEQKEDILNDLRKLETNNRKISFRLANAQKIFEEFEMEGGRLRILSFDEFWGKIRGQNETLIVFDDTPLLMMISEKLGMFESVSQDIKRIQEEYWTLTLDTGEIIKGNTRECQKQLTKLGASKENIIKSSKILKTIPLSKKRIALRNVIISFVWSYMRARSADVPKPHSNKINFTDLFEQCQIGHTWQEKERARLVVYAIFDHLKRYDVLKSWNEYYNSGSQKPDGIQFFIEKQTLIGG